MAASTRRNLFGISVSTGIKTTVSFLLVLQTDHGWTQDVVLDWEGTLASAIPPAEIR